MYKLYELLVISFPNFSLKILEKLCNLRGKEKSVFLCESTQGTISSFLGKRLSEVNYFSKVRDPPPP
jgi:hypothetical protein